MLRIVTSFLLLNNDLLIQLIPLAEALNLLHLYDNEHHNTFRPKYDKLQNL